MTTRSTMILHDLNPDRVIVTRLADCMYLRLGPVTIWTPSWGDAPAALAEIEAIGFAITAGVRRIDPMVPAIGCDSGSTSGPRLTLTLNDVTGDEVTIRSTKMGDVSSAWIDLRDLSIWSRDTRSSLDECLSGLLAIGEAILDGVADARGGDR